MPPVASSLGPPHHAGLVWLPRPAWARAVFGRDRSRCIACPPGVGAGREGRADTPGVAGDGTPLDAHHLLNRRLWTEGHEAGGYVVENGVALCPTHHREAETTRLAVDTLRRLAGIERVVLPAQLDADTPYDTWGNAILPNGTRLRGPLFDDDGCQRALAAGGFLGSFTHWVKGHRIPHLPWSEGAAPDDLVAASVAPFVGREVVVSVKLDGETTSLYHDHLHARSLGKMTHPSQSRLKAFHATIAHELEGFRVQVENMSAVHTYRYQHLASLFPVTAIWDERNVRLPWDDMTAVAAMLGLPTVPVLYRGPWDEAQVRACFRGAIGGDPQEGYVVTLADAFPYGAAHKSVAKFVSGAFRAALVAHRGVHWNAKPVEWNATDPGSPWAAGQAPAASRVRNA